MRFNPKKELKRFLDEDLGKGDITSNLLPKKNIKAKIISRKSGIVAGVKYAKEIFATNGCKCRIIRKDRSRVKQNQAILEISGPAQSVLSCERTALNLLSRMSGIATQTDLLVRKIKKTNSKAQLYATRKTAPGLRFFDKEAVDTGGGKKHRMDLSHGIMLKDNHLAVEKSLEKLIQKAKKKRKTIEVEVETAQEALLAASLGADIIMLDNFPPKKVKKTISELSKAKLRQKVKLEASGGINEKNIESFAKTGVDIISVGQLTNSVRALDMSLEVI